MRPILLIRNNFKDSTSQFGSEITEAYADFFKPASLKENLTAIKSDLPRQMFLSDTSTYESICERWEMAHDPADYTYAQGDMTGGNLASTLYLKLITEKLAEDREFIKKRGADAPYHSEKEIRFGYINDDGEASGFCLSYNKYNSSQWVISILHNATAPFEERRLSTYIHNISFPTDQEQYWSSIGDILMTLQSQAVAALLKPLFILRNVSVNTNFIDFLLSEISVRQCTSPSKIMSYHPEYYLAKTSTLVPPKPIHVLRTNYRDADELLGLREALGSSVLPEWSPMSPETIAEDIAKDMSRTLFIMHGVSFAEVNSFWVKTATLANYSYTQGDMSGGAIVNTLLLLMLPQQLDVDYSVEHAVQDFGFCYLTDEGQYASIRIGFNIEDPTQWIICIMENLTAPYEERPLLIYVQGIDFKNAQSADQIGLEEIPKTVKSKSIARLLSKLFVSRDCSLNYDLAARLDRTIAKTLGLKPRVLLNTCVSVDEILREHFEGSYGRSDAPNRLLSPDKAGDTQPTAVSTADATVPGI